jgi:hypothetical protein
VNFTVKHGHRHRAQAGLELAQRTPFIGSRIVLKKMRLRVLMDGSGETPDGVDLAV